MAPWLAKISLYWDKVWAFLTPNELGWNSIKRVLIVTAFILPVLTFLTRVIPDFSIQKVVGFTVSFLYVLLPALGLYLAWYVLSKLPNAVRLFALITGITGLFTFAGMWGDKSGMIIVALIVFSLLFSYGGLRALAKNDFDFSFHKRASLASLIGLIGLGFVSYQFLKDQGDPNPNLVDYTLTKHPLISDMTMPENPGEAGPYAVKFATYGSGEDKHRTEYGAEVTYKSSPVDGSILAEGWRGAVGWLRTWYWGFDATEFPRQGRVWMPDVDPTDPNTGNFPLVLMVHGNHAMEDFSDPGYDYIGRHLASRGIVFVSVDENFINSSMVDRVNPFTRGIGRENDARGWMLLQHLSLWRDWMQDDSHPLNGLVDIDRVALMGHSRGGEAVVVAAAFNRLDHYPDDATLDFNFNFNLRGIVAVAPVDQQYRPRKNPTMIENVNYFTIHGNQDGDVISFSGTAPYSRLKFTDPDQFYFKSSLYVNGANHGQFNTTWGRTDFGGYNKYILDTDHIMDPEEQRQIANVYFTAFLETVMNESKDYLPLFQDARYGAKWLPDTFLVNNYWDSDTQALVTFEEDMNPASTVQNDVKIVAENLSQWREEDIKLKYRPMGNHMARVAWDDRVHKGTASYGFEGTMAMTPDQAFVFSLSDGGKSTLPPHFEVKDKDADTKASEDKKPTSKTLNWTIEVSDQMGQKATIQLADLHPLYPQVKAATVKWSAMDEAPKSEVVMKHYSIPASLITARNAQIDLSTIKAIRFHFDQVKRGAIYLDDVGFRNLP